jgi:IclR family acetate operon transcriptional repressor
MPKHTENTIDDPDEFAHQLQVAAEKGYATDEGEQEVGVRCVAVAVPNAPSRLAISISGPTARMTQALVKRAIPLLATSAAALSADLC